MEPSNVEITVKGKKTLPMKAHGQSIQPGKRSNKFTKTQKKPFKQKSQQQKSSLNKSQEAITSNRRMSVDLKHLKRAT